MSGFLSGKSSLSVVTTNDIADSAVTTAKIADANVTSAKLGSIIIGSSSINAQTGTAYTLVLADAGKVITMNNSSANVVTIPPNSSVDFPEGTELEIVMKGAGQTKITGGSGVSVDGVSTASVKVTGQYASIRVIQDTNNNWFIKSGESIIQGSVSFHSSYADSTNATAFTSGSLDLGTGTKKIIGVQGGDTNAVTVSSVVVDGTTATRAIDSIVDNNADTSMWYVDNDASTSGTVVVTWSGSQGFSGVLVWSATDIATGGPADEIRSTASPLTGTINCNAGGIIVAMAGGNTGRTNTFTWTGLTERFDGPIAVDGNMGGASDNFATAVSNRTIQAALAQDTNHGMVVGAWNQA